MRRRNVLPITAAIVAIASVASLAGCGAEERAGSGRPVATFQVVGETFRIELVTPELIDHAQRLFDGEDLAAIPVGKIVRPEPEVNTGWTWHIDPNTLEFADVTTEVCDGLPSFVEDETLTSDTYCPWSATIIAMDYPEG
ncbi:MULTISPECIES: BP74-related protein [unclassified Leifsonia]|uniref:BP74-related protein n=1 Tax=unclassified Leifsonia TaxID=2663824 RepID=UPI0006F6238C|nr:MULTISPECIES: hypothetical protein [unclassified Leifsonia]KQX07144.1 hypothetical protein ASC59_04915 [Leifsonia sp. Root1293]KRA11427.1 hypothetical protein ASD61_04915 [Leifsonia sp. Root60]